MIARDRSIAGISRRRLPTDVRLFWWVMSIAIPIAASLWWATSQSSLSRTLQSSIAIGFLLWIVVVASAVRGEVLRHVRTLSSLVESIRLQDYSMRGTRARESGELAELYGQISTLTDSLKSSRRGEQELLSILNTVVNQINVAIVVCDSQDRIRLANVLASVLLKTPAESLVGTAFNDTVLGQLPIPPEAGLVDFRFPGAAGRWQVSQHEYRHQGRASRIMFIADLNRVLSDEEIVAWQRLIRVIGHEVNNSLTPIASLCQTLRGMVQHTDVIESLDVIAERAKGLQEFISAYSRLARLPSPRKAPFPAVELADKMRRIFIGRALSIAAFPDVTIFGDVVHLEHALINLIKNALEANPRDAPSVELRCAIRDGHCEFQVSDHGPGISNPRNLFVPFYTTKNEGAGIGLVLCRQIAARHHGYVSLENRLDGPGALATLALPLPSPQKVK